VRAGESGPGLAGSLMRDGPFRGRRAGRTSSRRGGKKTPAGRRAKALEALRRRGETRALETKDSSNDGRQQCNEGGRYHLRASNFRDSRACLSDRRASRMMP